jgi:hypothetical protein
MRGVNTAQGEASASFLKKRSKKLLFYWVMLVKHPWPGVQKFLCLFLTKKEALSKPSAPS